MISRYFLLVLGLLFSVVLFTIDIESGFKFQKAIHMAIFEISFDSSNSHTITSSFLGYIFFLLFSIKLFKPKRRAFLYSLFTILVFIGLYIEGRVLFNAFQSTFLGLNFDIGIVLFLMGLFIAYANKPNADTL